MQPLDPMIAEQIVTILMPVMRDEAARKARWALLFAGTDSSPDIDITDPPRAAIERIVVTLWEYGDIALGKPALWTLLKSVQNQVGYASQQQIDQLQAILDVPSPVPEPRRAPPAKSEDKPRMSNEIKGQIVGGVFIVIAALIGLIAVLIRPDPFVIFPSATLTPTLTFTLTADARTPTDAPTSAATDTASPSTPTITIMPSATDMPTQAPPDTAQPPSATPPPTETTRPPAASTSDTITVQRSGDALAVCSGNFSDIVVDFGRNELYPMASTFPQSSAGGCWCLQARTPLYPVPDSCTAANTVRVDRPNWQNATVTVKRNAVTLGTCESQPLRLDVYDCPPINLN